MNISVGTVVDFHSNKYTPVFNLSLTYKSIFATSRDDVLFMII